MTITYTSCRHLEAHVLAAGRRLRRQQGSRGAVHADAVIGL
jgi:hypothetical protein